MPDKYPDFATLAMNEHAGVDYRITLRRARPEFAIVTPHGGGIEPGTSEIGDAVAAADFSFYDFDGMKPSGNSELHITSTRFDEPMCLELVANSQIAVTLHGEHGEEGTDGVFIGGRDTELGNCIRDALLAAGFRAGHHPDPGLQGLDPRNLCNRGKNGSGVQLEISRNVRRRLFRALTREGRKEQTPEFHALVGAIRGVLEEAAGRMGAAG